MRALLPAAQVTVLRPAYPELRLVPVFGKRIHGKLSVSTGLGLQPLKLGLMRTLLGFELGQGRQRVG